MKKAQWFLSILIIFIIISLAISPDIYLYACLQGILVWGTVVLPAIFPFLFFTKLLTDLGIINIISTKFIFFSKLFKTPPISAYAFIISIFSGYPVGSKIVSDLYENKLISKEDAFKMTTFTSNSGPMFILGSVGIGMLFSRAIGLIMLFSHIFSAILNGLLYRNHKEKSNLIIKNSKFKAENEMKLENENEHFINKNKHLLNLNKNFSSISFDMSNLKNNTIKQSYYKATILNQKNVENERQNKLFVFNEKGYISGKTLDINKSKSNFNSSFQFAQSMWNSIYSILIIGGFICIFFVIIEMLNHINIILPLATFLSSLFGVDTHVFIGIINGIVEMTHGCLDISQLNLSDFWSTIICCGIITFGGFATMFQAIVFLQKFEMRIGFFLKQKITQTLFSVFICALLLFIFI